MSKEIKFRTQMLHVYSADISIQVLATLMKIHRSKRNYELNTWKLQHKRDVCHATDCSGVSAAALRSNMEKV